MYALQPAPERAQRWRLGLAIFLGSALHGAVLIATAMLEPRPAARAPRKIQMQLNVTVPRAPEQQEPPPPAVALEPKLEFTKPKRAKAVAEAAQAQAPASPPPLLVGLTLSSTSTSGTGGRYAVGETVMGAPLSKPGPAVRSPSPVVPAPTTALSNDNPAKAATAATMSHAQSPVYPAEAKREGVEGVVIVAVTIAADGHVEDVTVLRGLGYGLDESAVRAVRESTWIAASLDGRPVRTTRRLNIRFSLQS